MKRLQVIDLTRADPGLADKDSRTPSGINHTLGVCGTGIASRLASKSPVMTVSGATIYSIRPSGASATGRHFECAGAAANTWVELPKPEELKALADEIFELVQEMNHQRLSGVIDVALRHRKTVPRHVKPPPF
jgi:hypothetical protein